MPSAVFGASRELKMKVVKREYFKYYNMKIKHLREWALHGSYTY